MSAIADPFSPVRTAHGDPVRAGDPWWYGRAIRFWGAPSGMAPEDTHLVASWVYIGEVISPMCRAKE